MAAKFSDSLHLSSSLEAIQQIASPACQRALKKLAANWDQSMGLLIVPGFATLCTSNWMIALMQTTGFKTEELSKVDMQQAMVNMALLMQAAQKRGIVSIIEATDHCESWAHISSGIMPDVLEKLLRSMLILTWGAFEAMATDLWIEVLNEHPQVLAELSGEPNKWRKKSGVPRPSKDEMEKEDDGGKKIELQWIAKAGFDVSGCMGDILKRRFHFSRLDGLREAYLTAFPVAATDLFSVLHDESFDTVAAIRNVLVHKMGVADAEFLFKVKKFSLLNHFSGIQEGDCIRMEGHLLRALLEPFCSKAGELVQRVDEWLSANTPKK